MQDLEFTIEKGKLWMLQTRTGKRTAKAALRIAVELASEGLITREEAVTRVDPAALDQLLHPTIDPKAERKVIATGLPASPGAASGEIVFSADEAEAMKAQGKKVILVRVETSPEDIHGMHAAEGILTARGGMTSHAAVVARGMGKPCVSGAGSLRVDYAAQTMTAAGNDVQARARSSPSTARPARCSPARVADAGAGAVGRVRHADGAGPTRCASSRCAPTPTRRTTRAWRASSAPRASACAAPSTCSSTRDRIRAVREMILADDEKGRRAALAKLLPMQRGDFTELFEIMQGLPVTIRLLDPPLHEFLPHSEEEIAEVAEAMKRRRRAS